MSVRKLTEQIAVVSMGCILPDAKSNPASFRLRHVQCGSTNGCENRPPGLGSELQYEKVPKAGLLLISCIKSFGSGMARKLKPENGIW
jgi:hypothetical protein